MCAVLYTKITLAGPKMTTGRNLASLRRGGSGYSGVACPFHARGRNSQGTLASTTRRTIDTIVSMVVQPGCSDYTMARYFHVISGWGFV